MLFRNMTRKYYNAAGGEGAGGGGQGGGTPPAGGTTPPAGNPPPAIDYAALAAAIVAAQQGNQPSKSAFDKVNEGVDAKQKAAEAKERIKADYAFDQGFDKLITDNAALFKADAAAIRSGVGDGLEDSEMVQQLKVTAARAFFASEGGLALLSQADKAIYEQKIKGKNDAAVNAEMAWQIVERALHVKGQLDYQNKVRGGGSGNENKGKLPMMDAYLQRCIDRCRPKTK